MLSYPEASRILFQFRFGARHNRENPETPITLPCIKKGGERGELSATKGGDHFVSGT